MSQASLTSTQFSASSEQSMGDLFTPSKQDKQFKLILSLLLLCYLFFAVLVPMLEQAEIPREVKEQLPPQLAKIILKEKQLPPPPKPIEQPKPEPEELKKEQVKPEPKEAEKEPPKIPVAPSREQAREKAQNAGLAAMKDELFSMREAFEVKPSTTTLDNSQADEVKVERKMIAAAASEQTQSLAKSSVTQTVSSGELSTKSTQQVRLAEEEVLAQAGAVAEKAKLSSTKGQRSEETIRRTLEANKSRMYSLYNRALRKDPMLKGKVMFQITIEPNGSISAVKINSSELNNAKLERQLTLVLRKIKFAAEDVSVMTTIWSIDFLPS
ncbi:AgmX/PglI C-terminal domain-containing protein [Shewanella maritima]|uniref:AgmX/PglI C-terminal domain-containing protein n=1 Tax=Shewanella maritima TaxID=2520507 RepID=A0A411PCW1_9GAMM|nr:AgmX/PglI C-terminal domain-containing protein [Shewanella maritima]QBF81358.1 AgmX/PglI C-terminal domain-containing protein [Shewanella maritima]